MPNCEASAHAAGRSRWIYLLAAVFCGYATLFIYRTSFVIDGVRYFSLLDDEMISMRYARNLAHGYGLVWNPGGERIEGYTLGGAREPPIGSLAPSRSHRHG
jgi:hypothetical protein